MRLVLTNCNLIDCVNPTPVPEASIVVENGRISEILDGSRSPDTREAQVIDLEGSYLLPGLWDIHIHPEYTSPAVPSIAEQTARFGQSLMQGLTQAGVVGVRTGGAANFMDVAWKRTFNAGQLAGPQVFASGNFLTTTGGHFLTSGHARECDGPYGFVQAAAFFGGWILTSAVYVLMMEWAAFFYRGATIHIGAMLGTYMAFNVWMRIWPAQQKILTAIKNGEAPDGALVALAGTRSKHNTYMSIPLVFAMVGQHATWAASELYYFPLVILLGWVVCHRLYAISKNVKGF